MLITLICLGVFILNIKVAGQPRYWEILHNRSFNDFVVVKEKLTQHKSRFAKKKLSKKYLKITDKKYTMLGYSGDYRQEKCGLIESGIYDAIYQRDTHGYRENIEERYIKSDFILIGDSFIQSICENKPWDFKSALLKKTDYTYLNLGIAGTDFPAQTVQILSQTKDIEFKGILWFFYEGNDYETRMDEDYIKNKTKIKYKLKKIDSKLTFYSYHLIHLLEQNYDIENKHTIDFIFKFKIWLAEFIRGPATIIRFFNTYDNLLVKEEYDLALQYVQKYLDKKNIKKRYIIYIPSWQKISLHKIKDMPILKNHPQLKQFENLKTNVKNIAEKNGFKFIDTDNIFLNKKKPLSVFHYDLNTHFNAEGYELLSQEVAKNIN